VFLERFEEIRLQVESQVNVKENWFARGAALPELRGALRRYGITIGVTAPAQAAASIQGRPEHVRQGLVAALDECLERVPEGDAQVRPWLLAALAMVDNDTWRVRAREALGDRDWKVLEQLAGEVDVRKQPPTFLLLVADSLPPQMRSTRLELLRRTQATYLADLWANHELALELWKSGQPGEALRYFTAALALRPDNPGIYLNRGNAFLDVAEVDAAIADYRQAVALAPEYLMAHTNLGDALYGKRRLDEAIAEYREALRLNNTCARASEGLGNALLAKGGPDEAIAACREALRLKPDQPAVHSNLGNALRAKGRLDEAIASYREAIRIRKDYAEAYCNLGNALYAKGQRDEAIADYQEAIRIRKEFPEAHHNLGNALQDKGRLDEAIAEYQKAIRIKKDFPEAHLRLGNALQARGRLDEAIVAYREAVRLKTDNSQAHYNLGLALSVVDQLDEAVAEYRVAIRLRKDDPEAHCNLGLTLERQGEFREALEELRRGHELGTRNPRWPYASAEWLRQCERLVDLDGRLPGFLNRKATPANPAERIELAGLCVLKRLNGAAVRFYEEAFAAEPALAEKLGAAGSRYDAACTAALAGCGQGEDAKSLDEKQRAGLRRQALGWLRADLAAWRGRLAKDPDKARAAVAPELTHWLEDPAFAGVRGPEALARLSEAERQPWQQLWNDVTDTLTQAVALTGPEKRSNPK
jgi:tetratricopeptide (TPR) repeat protein